MVDLQYLTMGNASPWVNVQVPQRTELCKCSYYSHSRGGVNHSTRVYNATRHYTYYSRVQVIKSVTSISQAVVLTTLSWMQSVLCFYASLEPASPGRRPTSRTPSHRKKVAPKTTPLRTLEISGSWWKPTTIAHKLIFPRASNWSLWLLWIEPQGHTMTYQFWKESALLRIVPLLSIQPHQSLRVNLTLLCQEAWMKRKTPSTVWSLKSSSDSSSLIPYR